MLAALGSEAAPGKKALLARDRAMLLSSLGSSDHPAWLSHKADRLARTTSTGRCQSATYEDERRVSDGGSPKRVRYVSENRPKCQKPYCRATSETVVVSGVTARR